MKTIVRILMGVLMGFVALPSVASATFVGNRDDFRDETIYFVMTTRFYDGDPSNNTQCWDNQDRNEGDPAWRGDFKGLIEKLDYIKALGFTAVWITPVVENASGYDYHGYHAHDFSKVDHRYESEGVGFQQVIDEAHKRGMKVFMDLVV
ncbi:MAG: alpha-amylase, partial [Bacteroidaceae bacterium]|nr:alpha-amylase [Bacteroidaceae bacterium]